VPSKRQAMTRPPRASFYRAPGIVALRPGPVKDFRLEVLDRGHDAGKPAVDGAVYVLGIASQCCPGLDNPEFAGNPIRAPTPTGRQIQAHVRKLGASDTWSWVNSLGARSHPQSYPHAPAS
jgi:hypothetical protein